MSHLLMSILIYLVCVLIGYITARLTAPVKTIGTLVIDRSDKEDGPYLFLELDKEVQVIESDEYVTMKVEARDYLSQK